jgi:hypothetical protein
MHVLDPHRLFAAALELGEGFEALLRRRPAQF